MVLFSILIILLSGGGLFLQSGILAGKPRKNMFVYYTNLSNLVIFLYHILLLCFGGVFKSPSVMFIMTLAIWVTHLIYHFVIGTYFVSLGIKRDLQNGVSEDEIKRTRLKRYVLGPMMLGGKGTYEDGRTAFGNLAVHYLVPLLSVAFWLVFAPKNVPFSACFLWLVIPMAYFVFVMLRAKSGVPITKSGSLYPYAFMDKDALGVRRFTANMVLTTFALFALACVMYAVTKLFYTNFR